ncbi:MAG: VWA domain-containing protein [Salaquimonas sp.]|jgi:hypothetical protein|nr:VWA domain-containing protein [Salaquimonas sp.]
MAKDGVPTHKKGGEVGEARSSTAEITSFLASARRADPGGAGRLIFALDATMSRQPTWDRACQIQASMFDAVARAGGLSVQLVYFRGFGECRASKWVMNSAALRNLMTGIDCRGGQTQIAKVLKHANKENASKKVDALVFIGDAMEENPDRLAQLAGELGVKGTRVFTFQEGRDTATERTFRDIARLSSGAWFRLGPDSARELAELLAAIAVYASGGRAALEAHGDKGSTLLLEQMYGGKGNRGRD